VGSNSPRQVRVTRSTITDGETIWENRYVI
jgi:hypothetical protein